MEDGIDLLAPGRAQQPASRGGGLDQLQSPRLGETAHLLHHRQAAVGSGTDQPPSRPWDLLIRGQRGVSELGPLALEGPFFRRSNRRISTITSWSNRNSSITISPNRGKFKSTRPTIRQIRPPESRRGCIAMRTEGTPFDWIPWTGRYLRADACKHPSWPTPRAHESLCQSLKPRCAKHRHSQTARGNADQPI